MKVLRDFHLFLKVSLLCLTSGRRSPLLVVRKSPVPVVCTGRSQLCAASIFALTFDVNPKCCRICTTSDLANKRNLLSF